MDLTKKVEWAVLPVGGLGTRFLPATKASPKEMLPIVDKPLIQFAVEEALSAGIKKFVFVTSSSKRAIEDHFDSNYELEAHLFKRNKTDLLEKVRHILPKDAVACYVRQPEPLGLGHAVLCAKPLVGDKAFAVLLADDLMDGECLSQMVKFYEQEELPSLAVERIEFKDTDKYGIVSVQDDFQIESIVEKPKPEQAPSNLAVIGRYVLPGRIFSLLESLVPDKGGEVQLTHAIAELLKEQKILAYQFEGKRYDCGSKLGYLEATVTYGLRHPEVGERFRKYLGERQVDVVRTF